MKRPREDSTSAPPSKRVAESSDHPRLTTNDALQYLKAVKEKFKDDSRKYAEFLEVMKDFKAQRVDTNGVIARVKELFKGHDKLILGFNSFLPKGYQIVLDERPERPKQPVEFDQAISFVNKIKTRFQENEHVYKAFLEILNNYRRGHKTIGEVYEEVASLFHEHPDLLDEFTRFLPDNNNNNNNNLSSAPARVLRPDDKPHRSNALEKSNKRERASDRDCKAENRRRMEKERRDDRREDFERDAERLPHKRKSARRADELIRKQSQNGEGPFAFFDRAKARLRGNREVYKELIKVVNLYNEQIIDRSDLQSLAAGLLEKFPDLVEAFNELLQSENAEGYLSVVMPKKTEPDAKREREKDQEKDKDMDGKQSVIQNKAISDLDLTSCERCTPSYRLLPKNYPRLVASHRNDLAKSVLNDCWVSVTSGSEDYSFKHMRRNQYEESLFRCEDDRFELDMLLESTKVTAKHVAELMERIRDNNQVRIDDHLSAINLRCIERIYGDHGLDIIELLRKNPASALPVVHARLAQKEEEWTKCRGEMNKVWAEVYAKNYHKSLDHRSFYFKQQDKRSLSTKGLLAEIKEIHEKKKKEEDYVLSVVMGNRRPYIPDLKFNCPDSSIHQDLFQILKYSADELCTMEQSNKVMRMWTTFLECMFGLPFQRRGTEDTEEAAHQQAPAAKALSSSSESAASGACAKVAQDECTTASSLPESASRDDLAGKDSAENLEAGGVEEHRKASKSNAEKDVAGSKASRERGPKKSSEGKKSQSGSPMKVDREEGELSPSLDVDERRSLDHHATGEAVVKSSGKQPLKQDDFDEADADHDVDDEAEESVQQKSSDDSENGSEAGDEVSGSEMGTADGSPEDREDEGDDEKAESDYEGMADADEAHSSSDRTSMFCRPLAPHSKYLDPPRASSKNSTIFYGSDLFYILFRLYQTLYERIHSAKVNAATAEQKWKNGKDTAPPNLYQKFVRVLYNLLDGSADHSKFEDECRSIIGTQSYVLFTLDKLLYKLVKQLQAVAGDEIANKLLALQGYERSRGPGGFSDLIYHANACVVLQDENIYRFEHRPACTDFLVQLMDGVSEKIEVPSNAMETTFSAYLHEYLSGEPGPKAGRNVFLRRNESSEELEKAMKDVRVLNGLEHKISCKTSKASYVLDTEDLFHRRKYRRKDCSVCKGSLEAQATGCGHLCNSCSLQRQKGLCPSCFKDDKRQKDRVQRFRQWLDGRNRGL